MSFKTSSQKLHQNKQCDWSNFSSQLETSFLRIVNDCSLIFLSNIIQNTEAPVLTKQPTQDDNVLDDEPTNPINHIDCVEMAPDSILETNGNGEYSSKFISSLFQKSLSLFSKMARLVHVHFSKSSTFFLKKPLLI